MYLKFPRKMVLAFAVAALTTACSSSGTHVRKDGTAENLHWPNPTSTTFNKDRGTFPNLENLGKIRSGMSKDELYNLIGRPQFNEGYRVREWDYLFHFNTPGQGTEGVTTCQYKILFDNKKYARRFHWRAVDPVGAACPPVQSKPEPEIRAAESPVIVREVVPAPAARIRQ